jgi:hypothetical protein
MRIPSQNNAATMALERPADATDRARLLRAGLLALQPLLETERLSWWRVLPQGAHLVLGLVEGDDVEAGAPAWRAHGAALRRGEVAGDERARYHPLHAGGELVGFLQVCGSSAQLEGPQREFMARILADVAQALAGPDVARVDGAARGGARRAPAFAALAPAVAGAPSDAARLRPFRGQTREHERSGLLRALQTCDWNFTRTAERLGGSRSTVWLRTRRFGLARPERPPRDPRRGEDGK